MVVVRAESHQLATLPHDLLRAGDQLSFGLGELFPGLSYPVVASLDRGHLDAPFIDARMRHGADRLGDDATKDFALLHVFDIAPALIRHPADLLRVLLRKHHQNQRLPRILEERLIHLLRRGGGFESWPSRDHRARSGRLLLVPAGTLAAVSRSPRGERRTAALGLEACGRSTSSSKGPRTSPSITTTSASMSTISSSRGCCPPVPHEAGDALRDEWVAVGIRYDPDQADKARRVEGLMGAVGASIPGPDARHHEWTAFAYPWAELCALRLETDAPTGSEAGVRMAELQMEVDRTFLAPGVERRYAGLHNQPPDPPAMVHHLPRYLARRHRARVRQARWLSSSWTGSPSISGSCSATFSRTSGRACAFAKAPCSPGCRPSRPCPGRQSSPESRRSISRRASDGTDREPSSWKQFWRTRPVPARAVDYAKGLGDGPLDNVREILSRNRAYALLGLVVDKVDKIMHGMELGTAGMHNQVRQWAGEGFMAGTSGPSARRRLRRRGFLTSDHGNIEALGGGRPSEGVVADVRGERVRIYPDPRRCGLA